MEPDNPRVESWGSPRGDRTPPRRNMRPMKRLLFIAIAVAVLLVLALGGWAVKSVRRTSPAYA
jgi:hypothetical protein